MSNIYITVVDQIDLLSVYSLCAVSTAELCPIRNVALTHIVKAFPYF